MNMYADITATPLSDIGNHGIAVWAGLVFIQFIVVLFFDLQAVKRGRFMGRSRGAFS